MQIDKEFVHKIVSNYPLDPAYSGVSIPRGTRLNDSNGLYYFVDKVCIPNNKSLINSLIQEAHDAQGHPSIERIIIIMCDMSKNKSNPQENSSKDILDHRGYLKGDIFQQALILHL